ncbi:MFS transporter [Eubacterium sp.]|uniref:MFS transporter n=1 Tax=Eubacterium sp. TaxID=142586 RepID=UPI003AB11D87
MKKMNRWAYAVIGVVTLLFAGLIYAWSVMSKSIAASRPDWTATQVSLTFTIVMALFCTGGLIAGLLSKKINPKLYIIASGVFFAAGFFIASLTGDSPALLYIGFGVICGLGAGFAYNTVLSTMSQWFPDKQGLISGILLMGFGLSSFIIGKVYAAVTPSDGSDQWKMTFRILGIVVLVVMLICFNFFVKPSEDYKVPGAAAKKVVKEPALDIPPTQMVKKPAFWLYYIWAILLSAAGLVLVSQASGIATQVGPNVSDGNIATVVGLISILNGIGRVIFGAIFDKKGYRVAMTLDMIIMIVGALVLILALSTGNFLFIVLGFLIGGLAYGGVMPTNSAIISDFFGRTNYPVNYSLINTNLIIASFASTIAGKLYDASQSYMAPVMMMIGVTVVGFIVSLGIRRPKAK